MKLYLQDEMVDKVSHVLDLRIAVQDMRWTFTLGGCVREKWILEGTVAMFPVLLDYQPCKDNGSIL